MERPDRSPRNRIFYPDDTPHFPELQDPVFMDDLAFEIDGIMAQKAVVDTADDAENPAPGRQLAEDEYLQLATGVSKGRDGLSDKTPRLSAESPVVKYNPDQPRVPAGSAQGGEFVSAGTASAMAAGGDASAHIEIAEDSYYGNRVKAGTQEYKGKIVAPYPTPPDMPSIPAEDAIYMDSDTWGRRHVIDVKGRVAYELERERIYSNGTSGEITEGDWKVKWRSHIRQPQEAAPLPDSSGGSAAWAKKNGLSWSTGSVFDRALSESHEYTKKFTKEPDSFEQTLEAMVGHQNRIGGRTIEQCMRFAGRLEAEALREPFRLPDINKLRLEDQELDTKPLKEKARVEQLEHWMKVLDGKTREEAVASINREYNRLGKKQDANYAAAMDKHDALVKEGKEEEALALIKQHFANDVVGGKKTAIYTMRQAVIKDLIDRLVPSGWSTANSVDRLRLSRDMTSSVTADERNKVESGIHTAAVWLTDHLVPEAYGRLVGGAQYPHTPRFDIRYAAHDKDRAFCDVRNDVISLRPDSTFDVVVHEFGHYFDMTNNWMLPSYDFMRERSSADTVSMQRLTGSKVYADNEVAHPDRFVDAHVGKEYGNRDNEVTSMGLQEMANNPSTFYRNDREHFLYTMYLMRGGR